MNKNNDPILSGINMVIGERKDYNYTEPSKELEEEINNIADELFDKLLPQDGDFISLVARKPINLLLQCNNNEVVQLMGGIATSPLFS